MKIFLKVEIALNFFDWIKNFFREDFGEIVGVHHDGEKIFLARITNKLETFETNFEIDFEKNISPVEQLAEKIFTICGKQGWSSKKIALCLNEGDSVNFQPDFENIPQDKIESAVKIWAAAQCGENALYASAKVCGEFWSEAMSRKTAEEYFAAFEKNSMTLYAMTSITGIFSDKAAYVARLAAEKKSPNLIAKKLPTWNKKKIFAAAAGIFIFLFAIFFGKSFYDLNAARKELANAKKNIAEIEEIKSLRKDLNQDILQTKNLNDLLAGQIESPSKLNILIKLGKISDDKIQLQKINLSGSVGEIEGVAEKADYIKKYLQNLKSSVAANAQLEKAAASDDGKINFVIRLNFETSN